MYNGRHGGPWDRGSADSYYQRGYDPHYYKGGSYSSEKVELAQMTLQEVSEYSMGYSHNEKSGNKKDWG
jgi:hypothetical protein